jgi:hypothetical protein
VPAKNRGVIAIRTRLYNFFLLSYKKAAGHAQEITLIFSPEEVKAMRMRFADMADDDPLKPFFTPRWIRHTMSFNTMKCPQPPLGDV